MKSFDILDEKTPILGKRFLEASAGTGKTFAIENLACRLIREQGLKIEQILVVTFTKAATRELRQRIRAKLEEKKLFEALASFDAAEIFTIHGFCRKILQQFAFEAKAPMKIEDWPPLEESRALKAFLLQRADGLFFSAAQVQKALGVCKGKFENLMEAVLRKKKRPMAPFSEASRRFFDHLEEIPPFSVEEEFEKAALHRSKIDKPLYRKQAAMLQEMVTSRTRCPLLLDRFLAAGPSFLEHIGATLRNKPPPKLPGLDAMKEKLHPLLEELLDGDAIVQGLAFDWAIERKKIGAEEGKMGPDDLLSAVQERLGDPLFVEAVRKNYRAVIVDEFQDTDPIQWEIFEKLFKDYRLDAFYLVGDPKQAIYAFRSADVYTYLAAGKAFGEEAKASLNVNWRSTKKLGEELNRLFCNKPWLDLPKTGEQLEVPNVSYAKEGEGSLQFMIADGEEELFFPFIAEQLEPPFENNAILIKDRYQADRMQAYLRKQNIPCSIQKGKSLSESLAVDLLEELVLFDVRKIAAGPFFSWTSEQMKEEELFALKGRMAPLYALLFEKGFAVFFSSFLRFADPKLDADLYADLLDVVEIAASEKDPSRLLHIFGEIRQAEEKERIKSDGCGVQITTIHGSKGLEFDTVFALGLAAKGSSKEEDSAEIRAEKMRQFYVACTRAKRRLFLPVLRRAASKEGQESIMDLFLERSGIDLEGFKTVILNGRTFLPPPLPEGQEASIELPLAAKQWPDKRLVSFSSLSQKNAYFSEIPEGILPAGSETGTILHRIFEKAFYHPIQPLVAQEIKGTILEGWEEAIVEMVCKTLSLPLNGFSLRDVDPKKMMHELEFIFPCKQGMLKGFIDLCFEHEGKYYIVDWKSNYLAEYSPASVEQAMQEGGYFLQGSIYAAALKKFLPGRSFGGAFYIFLRAPIAYHFIPEAFCD